MEQAADGAEAAAVNQYKTFLLLSAYRHREMD